MIGLMMMMRACHFFSRISCVLVGYCVVDITGGQHRAHDASQVRASRFRGWSTLASNALKRSKLRVLPICGDTRLASSREPTVSIVELLLLLLLLQKHELRVSSVKRRAHIKVVRVANQRARHRRARTRTRRRRRRLLSDGNNM